MIVMFMFRQIDETPIKRFLDSSVDGVEALFVVMCMLYRLLFLHF